MKRKQHINTRRLRQMASQYRPGPSETGMGMWSPMPLAGPTMNPEDLDNQVNDIVDVVERNNLITWRALYAMLNAQRWGPGLFRRAVRVALDRGRIRQMSGVLYATHLASEAGTPPTNAGGSATPPALREVGRQDANREPAGV